MVPDCGLVGYTGCGFAVRRVEYRWGSTPNKGAEVGKYFKILLILALAIGIGVGISKLVEQKQQFLAMSEEEQRSFLADKIGSKVPDKELVEIQDAVISAVNGHRA